MSKSVVVSAPHLVCACKRKREGRKREGGREKGREGGREGENTCLKQFSAGGVMRWLMRAF